MATQQTRRKRKRRLTNRQIAYIQFYGLLSALFLVGFLFGRITKQPKVITETVTEIETETEYVPILSTQAIIIHDMGYYPKDVDETIYYKLPMDKELQKFIIALCEEENVDAKLIYSMIDHESKFDPDAISSTGDYGLMQINKSNHDWLADLYGISDFLDPYENVYCGVKIIASYLEKYDDYNKALMCYNMGENGATELWNRGIYSSSYSREIVGNMKQFEEVANGE